MGKGEVEEKVVVEEVEEEVDRRRSKINRFNKLKRRHVCVAIWTY